MAQAKRRAPKKAQRSKQKRQKNPTIGAIGHQLSRIFSEFIFILSLALGAAILALLLTYDPSDPAWSHSTATTEAQNILGTTGAYIADVLLYGFGWIAYLIPLVIWVWGWVSARNRQGGLFDLEAFLFRTLGGLVAILGFVGLADMGLPDINAFAPGGGILGDIVATGLTNSFGMYIAILLLSAFAIAGVTLVTAMGWGQILKLFVVSFIALFGFLGNLFRSKKTETASQQSSEDFSTVSDIGYGSEDQDTDDTTQPRHSYDEDDDVGSLSGFSAVSDDDQQYYHDTSANQQASSDDIWHDAEIADPPLARTRQIEVNTQRRENASYVDSGIDLSPEAMPDEEYDQELLDNAHYAAEHETDNLSRLDNNEIGDDSADFADQQASDHASPSTQSHQSKPLSPVAFAARFKGQTKHKKQPVPKPRIKVATSAPKSQQQAQQANTENTNSVRNTDHSTSGVQVNKHSAAVVEPAVSEAPIRNRTDTSTADSEAQPMSSGTQIEAYEPEKTASKHHYEASSEKQDLPNTAPGEAIGVVPDMHNLLSEMERRKAKLSNGQLPRVTLLDEPSVPEENFELSEERLKEKSEQLENLLRSYNIEALVRKVSAGPVITLYEIDPAPGVKVSQINNLSKDIARGLAVQGVRVLETIPGSTHIGIEVPNQTRETVYLRDVFESTAFRTSKSPLTLVLGKDISGTSVVANLGKMPHLLVAGTTGSGKSVAVNAMLLSILYKATPHDVRLIMIDPKMLELSIYNDIPHLLTPVVTDMKEAANALKWCVTEMERRYKLLSALKVRNIASFNQVVTEAAAKGEPIKNPLFKVDRTQQLNPEPPPLEPLPFIVVVIDELADMMMVVGKKVEELIARLAQKARAAGIHLVLATQRPSVDVITGLIKANVPTRIGFQVSSRIDSRTILDTQGAENLLGNGDMLYMPPGSGTPRRAHGAFVDDDEVVRVVEFLKTTGEPDYIPDVTESLEDKEAEAEGGDSNGQSDQDELYDEAVNIVTTSRKATISYLQRQLRIGFNRAARLVEDMEAAGIVSSQDSSGQREVVAPPPIED